MGKEKNEPYARFYIIAAIVVVGLLVHGELLSMVRYAPENILVQVREGDQPEESALCYGDIVTVKQTVKKKPLRALQSIYDFVDSSSFFANTDRGFYLLETGLVKYKKSFEIRIVCYSDNLDSVSYTIVNNENQSGCRVKENGKLLVC